MPGSVGVLSMDSPIIPLGAGLFTASSNITSAASGQPTASSSSNAAPHGLKDNGYQSPVESMTPNFPNRIVEKEVTKHDRLVVESLAFVNSFNSAQKYLGLQRKQLKQSDKASVSGHLHNKQLLVPSRTSSASSPETLTLVFLTVNRAVPYIAVALASLIRGHTPEIFVKRLNVHVSGGSGKTIQIQKSKLLMVKLYNPYNDPLSKERNLYSEMYEQEAYDSDRAVTAVEHKGKSPDETKYSFQISLSGYGIVSNAYPSSSVEPLIEYLETKNFQLGHPTDTSINFSYPMRSKKKVLEITPSLVNHIGFYSENQGYTEQGVTLSKSISTDVRFNIDDGHR